MEINPEKPTRMKVGGIFKFVNLNSEVKKAVMNRLSSKDNVLAQGQKGILPGIKINGKQVTRDNIKEFEISKAKEIKKLSKKEAYDLNFHEQVALLKKLGSKKIPRLESGRVSLILKLQ